MLIFKKMIFFSQIYTELQFDFCNKTQVHLQVLILWL